MTKFVIGVIVGLLLAEFNIMSEMLNFFVESGLNDVTIETDVEFYCNLYLKLRNEHESRFQKVH